MMLRMPSGAFPASCSSQPDRESIPARAAFSSSGRWTDSCRSSRRTMAHSSITASARKEKDMETPIPEATVRGRQIFLFRNPTSGSAASASAAPRKNGRKRGSKYRTTRKIPAKTAHRVRNLRLPELMGRASFHGISL